MKRQRRGVDRILPRCGRVELEVDRERLLRVLSELPLRARDVERVVEGPTVHRDGSVWAGLYGRHGAGAERDG